MILAVRLGSGAGPSWGKIRILVRLTYLKFSDPPAASKIRAIPARRTDARKESPNAIAHESRLLDLS